MLRNLVAFIAIAALVYLGLCAVVFVFQRSLIYYPQPRAVGGAESTLVLHVAGADLVVTVRPREGANALIYFGGNAEDVSYNLASFAHAFPDHALYLLHYRGYGGSSGTPSERALHADALALFDRVHAEHANIVVVGRSLGSGVALRLASQRPATRLVLVTPYDSLQELAAHYFPFFPVKWLLRDTFDSRPYAESIRMPTLLIAAERDEVIPRASTEQLHARFAAGVAAFRIIPGTSHNTISESPRFLELLREGLTRGIPATI